MPKPVWVIMKNDFPELVCLKESDANTEVKKLKSFLLKEAVRLSDERLKYVHVRAYEVPLVK